MTGGQVGRAARSPLLCERCPVKYPLGRLLLQLLAQRICNGDERGIEELQRELGPKRVRTDSHGHGNTQTRTHRHTNTDTRTRAHTQAARGLQLRKTGVSTTDSAGGDAPLPAGRAEPSRAGPIRAEPGCAELCRAEPSRAEPCRAHFTAAPKHRGSHARPGGPAELGPPASRRPPSAGSSAVREEPSPGPRGLPGAFPPSALGLSLCQSKSG